MWVRDHLDGLWDDRDFAPWYPRDGRPGLSPAQLATVCVLQFLLNLSDRQAAEAVRCRIDSSTHSPWTWTTRDSTTAC
ncbi:transposase [Streptomyces cyaneofuscatus]